MTIVSKVFQGEKQLSWKDLNAIKFAYDSPFQVLLDDNEIFYADNVLRLVPKRRLVAAGTWQGKSVVAKLFFDAKYAKKHLKKELAGIQVLQQNKIPTPALHYHGLSQDKRIHILICERILDAENLDEIWHSDIKPVHLYPLLQAVIIEIATQHVLGVQQKDLHLKNFLMTEKVIYTLDGAEIETAPYLLPKKTSMENVALFLAQFGVGFEEQQESLFRHYAKSRGWLLKDDDIVELFKMIKKCNAERAQKFAKKIFRSCSNFDRLKTSRMVSVFDRQYLSREFMHLLKHPEMAFTHPAAKMLKDGRSATVIRIKVNGRLLVIKRYNMKNAWHRLRRSLRQTRAEKSWALAQRLKLFNVPTAKPVAFISQQILGFRAKSYYICEYVSGTHAGQYFMQHHLNDEKVSTMVERIARMLRNIAKLNIAHGDLKITNILINREEQPILIDLDGVTEHKTFFSLHQAWRKDIRRFMQNFSHFPSLLDKFKIELQKKW